MSDTAYWYVTGFINSISGETLADAGNSYEICYEVAHGRRMIINIVIVVNLLVI